jgi:hypothetical protein
MIEMLVGKPMLWGSPVEKQCVNSFVGHSFENSSSIIGWCVAMVSALREFVGGGRCDIRVPMLLTAVLICSALGKFAGAVVIGI